MSTHQPSLLCHYRYDPLDRLTNQTQPDTPAHQRFYCKSRLATEIQGALQHSIVQYDDLLLAQQQRQGDNRDTLLLSTDLQRSVLHTLKANHPPQHNAFTPYGHHFAENGLTRLLGFNGEPVDPVTGCYLLGNGYRAFNPFLMRFNSPDSLSPFGKGGLNSYVYCLGDPINRNDQDGHSAKFIGVFKSAVKLVAKGRSAAARVVGQTRTIDLGDGIGRWALLPEVSPLDAVNARAQMYRKFDRPDSTNLFFDKFSSDWAAESKKYKKLKKIFGRPMPVSGRFKVLEYLKSGDGFSQQKMNEAINWQFDQRVLKVKWPDPADVADYRGELYSSVAEQSYLRSKEGWNIHEAHFTQLQKSASAIRK
jgi:RHS repeat-associated protein